MSQPKLILQFEQTPTDQTATGWFLISWNIEQTTLVNVVQMILLVQKKLDNLKMLP